MDDTSIPSVLTATSSVDLTLQRGDFLGEGILFHGQPLRCVSSADDVRLQSAKLLEVVRLIGTGTRALVYLVREVLSALHGNGLQDAHATTGAGPALPTYGHKYAVKVIPKAKLTKAPLGKRESVLSQIRVHQSLDAHRNIITLHQIYETSSAFILVLEHVPGENQTRELALSNSSSISLATESESTSSSLSSPSPSLVERRIYIIASVFSHMCDAVAACHDAGVYLRDLQLHDFWVSFGTSAMTLGDVIEDMVVVKLKGFWHSTRGTVAHEGAEAGQHRLAGSRARAADVTSLGSILTTMLSGRASLKRSADSHIRSSGVSSTVSSFLEQHIFEPVDDTQLMNARELGAWARDLPKLVDGSLLHGRSTSRVSSGDVSKAALDPFVHLPTILETDAETLELNSFELDSLPTGADDLECNGSFSDLLPHTSALPPPHRSTAVFIPSLPSDTDDRPIRRLDRHPRQRYAKKSVPASFTAQKKWRRQESADSDISSLMSALPGASLSEPMHEHGLGAPSAHS
ncbi:hypothetical protein BV25DRAFT_1918586 [Artomyces pyxidatus]|uniref:Uncharacterized protein n=1 Tax=Artomyces pyxidatus TaxID=48021 RepID=A0ACB8STV5_9AGAM|nr:hypothetical protein BV25DRAFT_1918586 [Artomyces pyxidatus]